MSEIAYGEAAKLSGREGQVSNELNRQNAKVEELHGAIMELEHRLEGVRAQKDSGPGAGGQLQPMPVLTPIADRINNHTGLIEGATNRLRSLLSELEI